MIKIVVNMPIKEGLAESFKATAKELVEKSAAEAGNIYYTLNESVENPGVFAIMECWKDQAAIDFCRIHPCVTYPLSDIEMEISNY